MRLVDSHSHIYSQEFEADLPDVIRRAENESIMSILMPAIDSSTHSQMMAVEAAYPAICMSMMGLHPCSVKENFQEELKTAEIYFNQRKFIAVGETGLDYYWDLSFVKQQETAFQQQIEWALHCDIPVVIHSRNSIDQCIEMISKNQKGKLKGVFHCFSGSIEQAKKIIDLNFYLGIGGVLTFKRSGLDAVVANLELDKIVLETDAPYLAPVPFRGKRNESSYLKYVVEKLAEVKNLSMEEISDFTSSNAEKLFQLNSKTAPI
jgi:TatD DNase family protein